MLSPVLPLLAVLLAATSAAPGPAPPGPGAPAPAPAALGPAAAPLEVAAVAGGVAELPCDTSARVAGDSVLLVVWYRGDDPIYSWDARGGSQGGAVHWSAPLGPRALWSPLGANLTLRPALPADRADYRCRADFGSSPTRITRIRLQVVEPPGAPTVTDESGRDAAGGRAGPYREGDSPRLRCSSAGGNPPAALRWYKGGRALDTEGGELVVPPLRRADLLASFSCQATNSPLLPPAAASVLLDMHLPPLSLEIAEREPLSAGREGELSCRARGARPPPRLSWWLGGRRLDSAQTDEESSTASPGANATTGASTLRLTAPAGLHAQRLTCRAEHPLLASPLEAHFVLDVLFAPTVTLSLGANLNPDDIEEGDDVYFECRVVANPPPYKLVWEHNGKPLAPDARAGVRATAGNLVLRAVRRPAAGTYTCSASNVEGDARSSPVILQIMYKPVCSAGLRRSYGVARNERAELLCEVDAFPPPDSWAWALNGSAGSVPVAAERFSSDAPGRSTLAFVPLGEADYGTALCWAANLAGRQVEPCALRLRPAEPPAPPAACELSGRSAAALDVSCESGADGGSPQWFQLEVWRAADAADALLANVTAKRPRFRAAGLAGGGALRLVLYAANARGRSEVVTLAVPPVPPPPPPPVEGSGGGSGDWGGALATGAGAAGALLLLAFLLVGAVRFRRRSSSDYDVGGKPKGRVGNGRRELLVLHDDKNPDVVPARVSDRKLAIGESADSGGPPPPPYSRAPPSLGTIIPAVRAGREVVTTRVPLPAAQESDV